MVNRTKHDEFVQTMFVIFAALGMAVTIRYALAALGIM